MFSRATKSVVKFLGQCSYSVGGENFKAITATGEFGQSLSQFLKKSSKFESVTVNEGITKSTQNGFNFQEGKKLHSYKDTMPELTRFRLNSESKSSDVTGNLSQIQKIPSLEAKKEGEDIIDILRKFPLAEESETANHLQMMPHTLQSKTTQEKMFASHQIDPTGNQARHPKLWLGDTDCGDGPPGRPTKSPCSSPEGPCKPARCPGYPKKKKPEKKPFCVRCPPKRPCNDRNADLKFRRCFLWLIQNVALVNENIGRWFFEDRIRCLGLKTPDRVLDPNQKSISLKNESELFQHSFSYSRPIIRPQPEKPPERLKIFVGISPEFLKLSKVSAVQQSIPFNYLGRRSFSTSRIPQSSKSDSHLPSKCKTVTEICDTNAENPKDKCPGISCLKKVQSLCKEEKPKCSDKKKYVERLKAKAEKLLSRNNCPTDCVPKKKVIPIQMTVRSSEKHDYPSPTCPPEKNLKPNPCPCNSIPKEISNREPVKRCPPPPPLPKPPSQPQILCPCPPPPKLPPDSCPCIQDFKSLQQEKKAPPPCPPKLKNTCSQKKYYCQPEEATENKCNKNQKRK
ncbi:uncharacterized protein LOC117180751 [Belonocnema kinseyi]|uniref:uncharacterized protein LOC117180751 n=1 Tax=Belonocnema kinseyi TaxID=2817044 RepID=UPI00143D4879|nr:uncharacterized protein LOC117180751 [Belonocnema kinseyi]